MKTKDVRLHLRILQDYQRIHIDDHHHMIVATIGWGKVFHRTKSQAIAIAERLCDRFNAGQEK